MTAGRGSAGGPHGADVPGPGVRIVRVTGRDWRTLREVRLHALAEEPSAFGSTLERELAYEEHTWR